MPITATEATCRLDVNNILLESLCILTGEAQKWEDSYQHQSFSTSTTQEHPNKHPRSSTRNNYDRLKMQAEVDLMYYHRSSGTEYTGRSDYGIGIHTTGGRAAAGLTKPTYLNLCVVVEAKSALTMGGAVPQTLAYMACLWSSRKQAGKRPDCTTYGIATDGMQWVFLCIAHDGTFRQSDPVVTKSGDAVKKVMTYIVYILCKSHELLTPTNTPSKREEAKEQPGVLSLEDMLLRNDDSATLEIRIDRDDDLQEQVMAYVASEEQVPAAPGEDWALDTEEEDF